MQAIEKDSYIGHIVVLESWKLRLLRFDRVFHVREVVEHGGPEF